ncbi:MAG: dTDP-4-dehydrorhamnose reductase [Pleurocapsa minor GSE-CHR-MK-17-07R]|jgi:dTDP-4-dehydrorhamnose reductase|nr:dTDP-4-dehydrorhamnose reductase [Pleurocapsa minor GSE-CHR-MK 17-07R]
MRILIIGAEGRLGSAISRHAQAAGHDVVESTMALLDITDFPAVSARFADVRPELVVHAAAWTDVDGCARDPEKALVNNGIASGGVAMAARQVAAPVVYVSTNEVFSGAHDRAYREDDAPQPANPYGYSKWVGEVAVRHANPGHYIVRTSWLFAHGGRNFVQAILRAADEGRPLRVVQDEVGNPTYTEDVAEAVMRLCGTGAFGVYHLVNEGAVSRYDFAREVLRLSGRSHVPIEPIMMSEWQRASTPPRYSPLENHNGAKLGITLRAWQDACADFMAREGLLSS